MSHRLNVVSAVVALITAALPNTTVLGLADDAVTPQRVEPGGRVVVRSGDPGEPEVDLCPPVYHYQHQIPVEIAAASEAMADALLVAIGVAVSTNPTLGGLCTHIEPRAPLTGDIYVDGARALRGADLVIVAHYSTTSPLG